MFKKTIKFTDFNDQEVEEDFYFHLSKADLVKLAADGDMETRIRRIIASQDNKQILLEFEAIIRSAVGVRSEDGRSFIKNEETQSRFMFSPAYDELLFELISNPRAASEFIANLVPESMAKEMRTEFQKINPAATGPFQETDKRTHSTEENAPVWKKEDRLPTTQEMESMSRDDFVEMWKYFNKQ